MPKYKDTAEADRTVITDELATVQDAMARFLMSRDVQASIATLRDEGGMELSAAEDMAYEAMAEVLEGYARAFLIG